MKIEKTSYQIKTEIEELNHKARLLQIDLEEGKYVRPSLIGFKVNSNDRK